jgi:hypothetical protein
MTFDIIASLLEPLQALFGGAYTPGRHGEAAHPAGITTAPFSYDLGKKRWES